MEEVFLRGQFTFYRSFYKAMGRIEDLTERCQAYDAVCNYALNAVEPDLESMSPIQQTVMDLVFPVLESARRKAEGGQRGGIKARNFAKDSERIAEGCGKDSERISEGYPKDSVSKGDIEKDKEIDTDIDIETQTEGEGNSLPRSVCDFDIFWNEYPKKVGKETARHIFQQTDIDLSVLLDAIREQRKSIQWTNENGRYIPEPAKWLEEKRWEDELPPARPEYQSKEVKASGILGDTEREALQRMMEG